MGREKKHGENVEVAIEDGVATITLSRPAALNALDAATLDELDSAIDEVDADAGVRVVVMTGAGEKAFVAGADIAELATLDTAGAARVSERGQRLFRKIDQLGKPVIAAVNGFALGGGCELALACTLRVASENARLGLPEVKLGVIPGYGGTQRLARLVGRGLALELILTGEMVSAERALAMGLVNHVVPQAELAATCRALADKIRSVGPLAVRAALTVVDRGLDLPLDDALAEETSAFGRLFSTADAKEGLAAFLEKRKAAFRGR